jgi:hypothetical protein
MAERASVVLKTLHCIKQNDEASQGSEPYVWPFLAALPFGDFQSTPKGGTTQAAPKLVLGNELAPGQSVPLQPPFNALSIDFKTGQRDHQVVLVVGLLEDDRTNPVAIAAGQEAFLRTLNRQAGRYLEYLATDPEDAIPIALDIADDARTAAMEAIAAKMTTLDIVFNRRDDMLGIAIRGFRKPLANGTRNFVLTLDSPGNRFTIDGSFSFRTPIQDPGHEPTEGPNQPVLSG